MTDKVRIRVAAGLTALFLAALSAAGLAVRHDSAAGPSAAQPARSATSAQPAVAQRSDGDEDEEGGEHD